MPSSYSGKRCYNTKRRIWTLHHYYFEFSLTIGNLHAAINGIPMSEKKNVLKFTAYNCVRSGVVAKRSDGNEADGFWSRTLIGHKIKSSVICYNLQCSQLRGVGEGSTWYQ